MDAAAEILEDIALRCGDGNLDLDDAERLESEADQGYSAAVRDDDVLVVAFEARVRIEPSAFDGPDCPAQIRR